MNVVSNLSKIYLNPTETTLRNKEVSTVNSFFFSDDQLSKTDDGKSEQEVQIRA